MNNNKFDLARANMIEQQIRPWDVLDQNILDLVASTPRENFVSKDYEHLAFADLRLPLGHNQHMMTPKVEARILQSLTLEKNDQVLEIGTGSGYLTACLAKLGAHVDSVELHGDLSNLAKQRLDAEGIANVELTIQNAMEQNAQQKTYDAIVITGSLPGYDDTFESMLAPGGRLFAIIGEAPAMQATLITKDKDGNTSQEGLFETSIPALIGCEAKQSFVF